MPLSVDKPGDPLHRFSGFSASAAQCRPLSRGTVEIRSADPLAPPRIVPTTSPIRTTRRCWSRACASCARSTRQPSFRKLVRDGEEYLPGRAVDTPAALEAFARAKGGTVFQPAGTCRMGGDAASVVDERLRVRGVERSARDRCLGDAADGLDQHQCRRDHDRREGRGA